MTSRQTWARKFAVAISGVRWSVCNQNSFWIHLPMTVAVIGLAVWLRIEAWRWTAIVFAITIVLSAELLNTSIELLLKVLHPSQDERIGRALDVAAGAVLIASMGAVTVGLIVLGPPLWGVIAALL